jgi:hypothetical protein
VVILVLSWLNNIECKRVQQLRKVTGSLHAERMERSHMIDSMLQAAHEVFHISIGSGALIDSVEEVRCHLRANNENKTERRVNDWLVKHGGKHN